MHSASFRFYGPLNDFLHPDDAHERFPYSFWGHPAIKDAIEAIGVPHPEIDLILVNGRSVTFEYALQGDDLASIYPRFFQFDIGDLSRVGKPRLDTFRFVIDTHLGRLASYLRMLGFDSLYRNDFADDELAQISALENRILLTRDRGLLKRSEVQHGYCVRESQPRRQLVEIILRFELIDSLAPFTRCMRCNQVLERTSIDLVRSRVPARVLERHERFLLCPDCERVYWQGSHHAHMEALIAAILAEANRLPGSGSSLVVNADEEHFPEVSSNG
jgi:uncharacterized protein with PIN domain